MTDTATIIKNNLDMMRAEIRRAGADPDAVKLVAASKTVPPETLNLLKALGVTACGENRVQEFLEKADAVDTEWHFIGRLQTNKVKYLVGRVALIHSVDRPQLAQEIERQSVQKGVVTDVLVQVSPSGEPQKGGVPPGETEAFCASLSAFPHIRLRGLMAVMPDGAPNRQSYLQMRALYDTIKGKHGAAFDTLSMGMSNDYALAARCGATMLRPGRVLFGERG